MCHHPLRFSEDCVDFNMHEEIEEPEKATGIEEKKLPDNLDEAAEEHAGLNFDRQMEYKSFWNDVDTFKAGAEWQKAKMMEEAVEGKVAERIQGKLYARCQIPNTMGVEFGDKVRVIIIKED